MRIRSRKRSNGAAVRFPFVAAYFFVFSCPFFHLTFSRPPLSLSTLSRLTKKNRRQNSVRARLVQFAGAFAARACPQLGAADVRAAAAAAIARLPPPLLGDGRGAGGASGAGDGPRELQLVFRHDCL